MGLVSARTAARGVGRQHRAPAPARQTADSGARDECRGRALQEGVAVDLHGLRGECGGEGKGAERRGEQAEIEDEIGEVEREIGEIGEIEREIGEIGREMSAADVHAW